MPLTVEWRRIVGIASAVFSYGHRKHNFGLNLGDFRFRDVRLAVDGWKIFGFR